MHISARGWILEKICREIAEESGGTFTFVYSERNDSITSTIPRARAYFFAHYALYTHALAKHPELHSASLFVWFTHPDFSKGIGIDDLVFALQQADLIFTANSGHGAALSVIGISKKNIRTFYGGADPQNFRPHSRGRGKVAFVGAYYERKQPDRMLQVMQAMPETSFLLLGPSPESVENKGLLWANYSRYTELQNLKNLEIAEVDYSQYPAQFARADVYVSLSNLEGGPIPLIEALMANVVPVVTRTGFCEELVTHGKNGFLLETDAPITEIINAIRAALQFKGDVTHGSADWSWRAFGEHISWEMCFPLRNDFAIAFGRSEKGARRYLREGWDSPESKGAWQFAPSAMVLLPIQDGQRLSELKMLFRSGSAFGAAESVEVQLRLNGEVLGTSKVRANRQCELVVGSVPPSINDRVNHLSIEVLTPTSLLEGEVPRLLRLERIEGKISPADEPTRTQTQPILNLEQNRVITHETETEEFVATEFIFGTGKFGSELPASCWNEPEESGVWSNQAEATVVVPFSSDLGSKVRMLVEGRTYEPVRTRNASLAIVVSNGSTESVAEFSVNTADCVTYEVEFDNAARRRIVQVRLSLSNIFSPSDLGTDPEDSRKLGFLLRRIAFEPVMPSPRTADLFV
ncbi:glycosyltransferase [Pseudoroseomonas wenyumeiae]|uniref:Glycosyltransferase n=2 Tax=Teichococcus wenyumeiae TaxID=2478470 RepID=A0A3A9J201_9PROT|nr:glycosyltransferase [Pseudoroseomonas wenyumeiae]RMI14563.1 glycosyltransferase [Pseudoroseomonas wenyumeiae]